jgi:type II secretory pathway pseudopilin PulG
LIHRRLGPLDDERGITLVELLVATAAGAIVIAGVSASTIVVLRESNRVSSHVEANQRARLTMTKVIDQLHSACFAYEYAPVLEKSNGTSMTFLHSTTATAAKVSPTPVKSTIALSGGNLIQSDYAATNTAAPWAFSATAATTTLMTGISQISASIPIFRYYPYENGQIRATPFSGELSAEEAEKTAQVTVAFKAGPLRTRLSSSSDPNVATPVQNSALLRFTPSGFETSAAYLPCE